MVPLRMSPPQLPEAGTVERWAFDFISGSELSHKLAPPPPPSRFSGGFESLVLAAPGRPPELVQREGKKKTPRPGALKDPAKLADVLHTFLHHELQAAELMAWAVLAFPDTPLAFRKGLLGICQDELRHVALYRAHLEALGHPFGSLPINDWFWRRVPPQATTPATFVARLGIGFEGANLDHGARFAAAFAAAGDEQAAAIQSRIVEEEVPHTAFALHWFRTFTGAVDFDAWRKHLPAPISPMMTRGVPMNLEARRRAGYPEAFLSALAGWGEQPASTP